MKIPALSRPLATASGLWGLAGLGAIVLAISQAGVFGHDGLNLEGWPLLWRFVRASAHPDLSPELLRLTLDSTLTTLAYAVCGNVLSVILGLVGGVVASEVWWLTVFPHRSLGHWWLGVRMILVGPRAIHELLWGLLLINILGLNPLVAILAIAIPFGAITAKVFSEILDETPRQPLMAMIHSGATPFNAFLYGLLPQAGLNLLSYIFYRFECSIRSAAVLGIIGAGGLGYQILLSLQSLRYQQLWTFFLALLVLNGLVDFSSAWLRQRLGCPPRLVLNLPQRSLQPSIRPTYRRDPWLSGVGLGLLLLIPFCFWYVAPDLSDLWSPRTKTLFGDVIQTTLSVEFREVNSSELLSVSLQTLSMSILAIAGAGIGGILLSFPAATNFWLPGGLFPRFSAAAQIRGWLMFVLTRALLLLCRAIPAPIWALVLLFILFPGIWPGAIALGLHNLGVLGRLMAEGVENLPPAPLQALKAQGAPGPLVFLYGVLPLTLPRFLAYGLYRWEVCIRETVIVGLVGAGGLGRLLTEQLSSFDTAGIMVTLGCLILLTLGVDWISVMARRSLR